MIIISFHSQNTNLTWFLKKYFIGNYSCRVGLSASEGRKSEEEKRTSKGENRSSKNVLFSCEAEISILKKSGEGLNLLQTY